MKFRAWGRVAYPIFFVFVCACFAVRTSRTADSSYISEERSIEAYENSDISMLIVVLTATRYDSLQRLLESLAKVRYGEAVIDLQVNVDMDKQLTTENLFIANKCLEVATSFLWTKGRKTVFRRLGHAGLSQGWFEVPYQSEGYEYVSILEDDMQVSPHFFSVFALILHRLALDSQAITGFCLHPDDWEVLVPRSCSEKGFSKILYESPEPCNWGPIWKYEDWRTYNNWVFATKAKSYLPYVPDDVSYNFNKYLDGGKDVQSSWVWKYNYLSGKKFVRYSFSKCLKRDEVYLSINHKEPGEHFKAKLHLQNDPALLDFDLDVVLKDLRHDGGTTPFPFSWYTRGGKSMRG